MTINPAEALRYLQAPDADDALRAQVRETAEALMAQITPRSVYRVFDVARTADGIALPEAGMALPGRLAADMLADCAQAALLVCTLGARYEALARRWRARDMARAVILDACANAWVEAGCDEAERELDDLLPGLYRTDRFSPGYGDLPLTLQDGLLAAVNAGRRLGVTANEAHLLTPAKTVTAVIGLSEHPQPAKIRGCAACMMRADCAYRKRGNTCALG